LKKLNYFRITHRTLKQITNLIEPHERSRHWICT